MNPRQQKYYDLLAQAAQQRGYQILGSYIDAHTKIQMQCPEKHELEIQPYSFKNGHGCARCTQQSPTQSRDALYSQAKNFGYQILGVYKNSHTKIQMRCPKDHRIEIQPYNFRNGHGCARCAENCTIQAREKLCSQAETRGYTVLGPYVYSYTKIQMRCPENHVIEIAPTHFKAGKGCARCADCCPSPRLENICVHKQHNVSF